MKEEDSTEEDRKLFIQLIKELNNKTIIIQYNIIILDPK